MEQIVAVKVDDKNLQARLRRIIRKIDSESKLSVSEVARFGRDQIQLFMPKDTKQSAESIGYQVTINARGLHEARIIQISTPHQDRTWNDEWFNIPLWMFNSPKAIAHYRKSNGSIIAMRGVTDTLRKEFGVDVKRRFKDPTIYK